MAASRVKYGATTTIYFYLRNMMSYNAPASGRSPYCYLSKDNAASAITTYTPTEVDPSYMPGVYRVDLSTAETSAYVMVANLYDSSYTQYTSEPVFMYTDGTLLAGSSASFGTVNANVAQISNDVTAASNMEKYFDGTGYGIQPAGAATEASVDAVKISGSTTAADNMELAYNGTGYSGGTTLQQVDVSKVSGGSAAADNLELAYDGTGYIGGSTLQNVNVTQIGGNSTAATAHSLAAQSMVEGEVSGTGTVTGFVSDTGALSSIDNFYVGRLIIWTSGSLQNSVASVTDYTGYTKTFVTSVMPAAPANNDDFILV